MTNLGMLGRLTAASVLALGLATGASASGCFPASGTTLSDGSTWSCAQFSKGEEFNFDFDVDTTGDWTFELTLTPSSSSDQGWSAVVKEAENLIGSLYRSGEDKLVGTFNLLTGVTYRLITTAPSVSATTSFGYSAVATVPLPGTLGLLGLGLAGLGIVRRRQSAAA